MLYVFAACELANVSGSISNHAVFGSISNHAVIGSISNHAVIWRIWLCLQQTPCSNQWISAFFNQILDVENGQSLAHSLRGQLYRLVEIMTVLSVLCWRSYLDSTYWLKLSTAKYDNSTAKGMHAFTPWKVITRGTVGLSPNEFSQSAPS